MYIFLLVNVHDKSSYVNSKWSQGAILECLQACGDFNYFTVVWHEIGMCISCFTFMPQQLQVQFPPSCLRNDVFGQERGERGDVCV